MTLFSESLGLEEKRCEARKSRLGEMVASTAGSDGKSQGERLALIRGQTQ